MVRSEVDTEDENDSKAEFYFETVKRDEKRKSFCKKN